MKSSYDSGCCKCFKCVSTLQVVINYLFIRVGNCSRLSTWLFIVGLLIAGRWKLMLQSIY